MNRMVGRSTKTEAGSGNLVAAILGQAVKDYLNPQVKEYAKKDRPAMKEKIQKDAAAFLWS